MESWKEAFKLNMRKTREEKGIKVVDLADEMEVTIAMIYRWESLTNTRIPSVAHVRDICKCLGVTSDYLLFGEE
jgi:transcriptional regulator with XRE-family HTH domain